MKASNELKWIKGNIKLPPLPCPLLHCVEERGKNLKVALVLVLVAAWCFCGCTVVPKKVGATQNSWDGSEQNSGFLGWSKDGKYGLLTTHARDRYNALIDIYGNRFAPTLVRDAGVSAYGDGWKIDPEHLAKFATMNRWKKEGK